MENYLEEQRRQAEESGKTLTSITFKLDSMIDEGERVEEVILPELDIPATVSGTMTGDVTITAAGSTDKVTITNSNKDEENLANLTITLPESTVDLNGKFDTVVASVSDNTLNIKSSTRIKNLTLKKGNAIVADGLVSRCVENYTLEGDSTIGPKTENNPIKSSSFSTAQVVNLNSDLSLTTISFGIAAAGNYIWNLCDHELDLGRAGYPGILIRGPYAVVNVYGPGTIYNKNNQNTTMISGGSTLNVYGGTWMTDGAAALYAENGTINVYGGEFKTTAEDKSFICNCLDAHYLDGTAKINIYGGKFYGFNPAASTSEQTEEPISFVAPGYKSVEVEEGIWEVVKDE